MNKNKHFSAQQNEQSRQYIFPYHYITNKQKKDGGLLGLGGLPILMPLHFLYFGII
tara:strand:+ start:90 stop:257 length:168 start_codon:yes stop_codon:yes gene_type:complete